MESRWIPEEMKLRKYARRVFRLGNSSVIVVPYRLLRLYGLKVGEYAVLYAAGDHIGIKKLQEVK